MFRCVFAVVMLLTLAGVGVAFAQQPAPTADAISIGPADWPWWRGPTRNGVAASAQQPPLKWGPSENVRWQSPVPGRGHGSPTVVGQRVFLATAEPDRDTQSVVCYDRDTGKRLWQTDVHQGGLTKKGNAKSSLASSTVACDGTRVFINFLNGDAVYTTALSVDGRKLWQTKLTDYVIHQGYGSSPAVYQGLVLVSADNKGGGVVAGLDRATGQIVWKQPRPRTPNYSSPIILKVAGRDQLVMTGCDRVASFEPLTGTSLWEMAGATTECVTSTVTDGLHVYSTGGYPKNHIAAVKADGSGKVVWETKTRVYVPSLLLERGYLYGVLDAGFALCVQCDTGVERWKSRLEGTFSASPILVGDRVYATNEAGRTFVFKASPTSFELLADNQLGDEVLASPAICGSRIYYRAAVRKDGKRQEMLYCVAQ